MKVYDNKEDFFVVHPQVKLSSFAHALLEGVVLATTMVTPMFKLQN